MKSISHYFSIITILCLVLINTSNIQAQGFKSKIPSGVKKVQDNLPEKSEKSTTSESKPQETKQNTTENSNGQQPASSTGNENVSDEDITNIFNDIFGIDPNAPQTPSNVIGDTEFDSEFTEDNFGISGIYYYKGQFNNKDYYYKTKINYFKISDENSEITGRPDYVEFDMNYAYLSSTGYPRSDSKSFGFDDIDVAYFLETEKLFGSGLLQFDNGVIYEVPDNTKVRFGNSKSSAEEYFSVDVDYFMNSGKFYSKNKEDLDETPTIEEIKTAYDKALAFRRNIFDSQEAAKVAKTEMPSISPLNTKALQDKALASYNAKYNSINKGWTHHYIYVHGTEWETYTHRIHGHILYRQIPVVIARTNADGKCKADLMYFKEPYENGSYVSSKGHILGPIAYIGMPGGWLLCEKLESFRSKLAK